MTLLQLFLEFCKVGLFSVGGGLATIPFLTDLGERTGWFSSGQLADMIAISESTPGPMGVNMATYVGFTSGGSGILDTDSGKAEEVSTTVHFLLLTDISEFTALRMGDYTVPLE